MGSAAMASAESVDERLLVRAAGPGRIRGIGLSLWERAAQEPRAAGRIFAEGLREARALHSAERRLVQEVLFGLIRSARGLAVVLETQDPLWAWTAQLVLRGLPPSAADPQAPWAWDTFATRWAASPWPVRHDWSQILTERMERMLGPEARAFAEASDRRAPTDVRANRRRCTVERLAQRLRSEGVETTPLAVPGGLRIVGRRNLVALRSYRDGWFEVQDEGSQRVAAAVDAEGLVIDVCAGAGGKALAFAAAGAKVLALDTRPSALAELSRRAERAGVQIETRVVSEEALPTDLPLADRVIVDAPCTGTGVLRRHPEHRFLDEATLAERTRLQHRLLGEASALVAPRGKLVYATCSVLRDENEEIVAAFTRDPRWEAVREERTWPQRDGCDGFYWAVLESTGLPRKDSPPHA